MPMSTRVLDTIRSPYAVEQRAHALLARYLPLYLDEVARQASPDGSTFTPPERPTVLARTAADRVDDADLPALVVGFEGVSGEPVLQVAAGSYAAAWRLTLTAVTRDADAAAARELASVAAAAASALLVQTLGDGQLGIRSVRWTGETVADVEVGETPAQLRHVCSRALEVDVVDALGVHGIPPAPEDPPQDPGELPTVETTHVTVIPVEEFE
jgi:hypothetical protein